MLLRSNFSSFPHYFIYIFLTSGVKLHIHLLNVVVQFIVFLTLSTLICRGTDISKCFSESLGIRDNESRLYLHNHNIVLIDFHTRFFATQVGHHSKWRMGGVCVGGAGGHGEGGQKYVFQDGCSDYSIYLVYLGRQ